MNTLASDTAVEPLGDGRYRASLSQDWSVWEAWGPNGGYLASITLRAVGAHTSFERPASLNCHYLSVPRFDPVEVQVTTLKATRRAESLRATMTQNGKPVLEATVWVVSGALPGPQRRWTGLPETPPPLVVPTMEERLAAEGWAGFPFFKNIEFRPVRWIEGGVTRPAGDPLGLAWQRFRPQATFADDPWADACRATVLIDYSQFSGISWAFPVSEITFVPQSLDLYVAYHDAAADDEWLLCEGRGIAAGGGLIGGEAKVWSATGSLVANGTQQILCRQL